MENQLLSIILSFERETQPYFKEYRSFVRRFRIRHGVSGTDCLARWHRRLRPWKKPLTTTNEEEKLLRKQRVLLSGLRAQLVEVRRLTRELLGQLRAADPA